MASGIRASLKYGCLGLPGLAALVVAALFAVAWIQVRGEEIISSGLEQELGSIPGETRRARWTFKRRRLLRPASCSTSRTPT